MTLPAPDATAFLTVEEIAARLRTSKMTVYRLIHAGQLPGVVRVGRTFRIPETAYRAFLAGSVIAP